MSSSQLRSFRHTATVIAMELLNALCQVAAEIEKEHTIVTRQREGERKRAGKNKGKGRDKEFEAKAEEVGKRKAKVAEYMEDFFNGCVIFVLWKLCGCDYFVVYSSIGIAITIPIFVPSASKLWAFGSKAIPVNSWMVNISVMWGGFCPIR